MVSRSTHKPLKYLIFVTALGLQWFPVLAQGRRTADDPSRPDPYLNRHKPEVVDQGRGPRADASWSIVIASVAEGEAPAEAERLARAALEKVQTKGGLEDAFLEKRNKAWVILFGKYRSSDDDKARADLERIHEIRIDGGKPFADAYLCPPSGDSLRGNIPDFDLRNAKKLYGKARATYTLQVGIYGRDDKKTPTPKEIEEFREAAEKAATQLRREGEMAFYFHGPERSTVTVGLFTPDDIDTKKFGAQKGANAAALEDARRRHPYNLLNGKGIRERVPGVDSEGEANFQMQKTMLVAVP